jgi:glycosyltransferase 2 family protein
MKHARKWLVLALRAGVVIAIFSLILAKFRMPSAQEFTTWGFAFAFLGAALLNLAQSTLCVWRWQLIAEVETTPPPFRRSFWAYLEGAFLNQALPSFVGGDAVRVMRWHENGVSVAFGTVTVLFDRVFGAIGAATLALAASVLLLGTPVAPYKVYLAGVLSLGVLGAAAVILVLVRWNALRRLAGRVGRVRGFVEALSAWRPPLRSIGMLSVLGIAGQLLSGVAVCLLAHALHVALPWAVLVSVTGIILLLSMIPISLAGWGVREAGFLALLVPLGAGESNALALGIAFGISCLVGSLPGGVSILLGLARGTVEEA